VSQTKPVVDSQNIQIAFQMMSQKKPGIKTICTDFIPVPETSELEFLV